MNRLAKLTCWLMTAEMLAVAATALAARWPDIAHHRAAISFLEWRILLVLWLLPAMLAFSVVKTERKLRPKGMQLSPDHRQIAEVGVLVTSLFAAAMQGWSAAIFISRDPAVLHIAPQGVGLLIGGAFSVIYGNASAKRTPPVGLAAPEPGVWTRANLRSGWASVLLGISMIAATFAPHIVMQISMLILMPATMLFMLSQRRLMRGATDPHSPA